MTKRRLAVIGFAFAALVSVDSADAALTLKKIAIQGEQSPVSMLNYRRIRAPNASDAPGTRVAFYSPLDLGSRCSFLTDPDGGPSTTTLACERDTSPDGRTYTRLRNPSINVAGVPAFVARTNGGFDGVYRGSPPTVVALTNDPFGPQFLDNMSFAAIDDLGDVVFLTELTGGPAGDMALLRCSGGDGNCSPSTGPPGTGTLTTLVRLGDAIPDRAGRELCSFIGVRISSYGVVFTGTTKLDCTDDLEVPAQGIFRLPLAGALTTIALVGESSGIGPTTWAAFRGTPGISNNGKIGFQADLAGTPSGGLFVCDPAACPAAQPVNVVQVGGDDGSGNKFRSLSTPGISNAGDLAFNVRVTGGPAGNSNGVYVWRSLTNTFEVVVMKYDSVPGYVGAIFTDFQQGPPVMTSGGKVAFRVRFKKPTPPRTRFGMFIAE